MSYREQTEGTVGLLDEVLRRLRALEKFRSSVSSGIDGYRLAVSNGYTGTYEQWLAERSGSVLLYGFGPPS